MRHIESKIQIGIVRALRTLYPKSLVFAVPNGGFRSKVEAAIMKAEGVVPGVSDLIFIHKGCAYFIEVKSNDGRQTQYQKDFQLFVEAQGYQYWLVRCTDDVLNRIKSENL